jgi:flavin reductase
LTYPNNKQAAEMIDKNIFRESMSRLGAAVNIITTDGSAGRYGLTVSAVCSVTDTPPTLLVCINRSTDANQIIKENKVLCINVLASGHDNLSNKFSDSKLSVDERFIDRELWTTLKSQSPILKNASTALDCRITASQEVGSHTVFFCQVEDVMISKHIESLIYFNRGYHKIVSE